MEPVALTVQEAGKALSLGKSSIYELIRSKRIKAVRFSERGRLRIPRSEIERLVADGAFEST